MSICDCSHVIAYDIYFLRPQHQQSLQWMTSFMRIVPNTLTLCTPRNQVYTCTASLLSPGLKFCISSARMKHCHPQQNRPKIETVILKGIILST